MTEKHLQQFIDKGYDPSFVNQRLSIIFLLNRLQSSFFADARDYLHQFGLDTHDLRRYLNKTDVDIDQIFKLLNPSLNGIKNKLGFFDDFEEMEQKINELINNKFNEQPDEQKENN